MTSNSSPEPTRSIHPERSSQKIHKISDHSRFERALEIETVGVIFFDPAGDIVRANDAFLRMGGYTREDVEARRLRWDTLTPPEWMEVSRRAISQLKTRGSTVPYEKQYYRKDGSRFWGLFAAKGISEHEGVEFIIDITERKRTEAALRESEERLAHSEAQVRRSETQLRLITDTVPASIAYIDPQLRYERVNRTFEEFWGRSAEAAIGHSVEEVTGKCFSLLKPHLEAGLAGDSRDFEVCVEDDESGRILHVHYEPDIGAQGEVRGVVAEAHDITARKKAEEMLRTSEKLAAVGRLASSIAHEINNPLSSVTNLIYLASQSTDTGEIHKYLEVAERELRRVSAITNQTLRFHKQSSNPRDVTAGEMFESVASIFQGKLRDSRVQVEQRLRADKPIRCFDNEIRQVLSNLVDNAIGAMPQGGRLLLRSREATNWKSGKPGLLFTVADTGSGITGNELRKVFDRSLRLRELRVRGWGFG